MTVSLFGSMRLFLRRALPLLLIACVLSLSAAQQDAVSGAVEALQRGDLRGAEQTLRAELKARPNDVMALGVLGVVLDQEKNYTEAEAVYRRGMALTPRSAGLLNNYGNHLLATGKVSEAREVFLRVVAIDPGHVNADVQLARIALERKAPREAVKYLDRLPASATEAADVGLVKMQADYEAGRGADGDALLERLSRGAESDPQFNFPLGVALAATGHYDKAENFLERAVQLAPDNFEAMYDLGLAAAHAGHNERAREVLERALEQQPANVNVMYDLAAVDAQLNRKEAALELLARAQGLAPDRPDIQVLLAHTAADLGDFGDAAKAWERYRKLKPDDDAGRREHAFTETAFGENMQHGLAELEWYARKHPNDAVGHYELGTAESASDSEQALKELNRALALKPDLTAAHVARGLLQYRQGRPEAALPDFQFAASREPANAAILDRLGQIDMALGRTGDALPVLRKAAELAPRDSSILLRYARALTKAGQKEEASAVFARCRELGPAKSALPHPAGLVDFLSLSPEEQFERYRAGVERTVRKDPANVEAEVRYMELLLEDGKPDEAVAVSRKIVSLTPSPALIAETSRALLAAERYAAAKEFLEQVGADGSGELALDRAIADFHVVNARTGLDRMDRIPQAERNGDYYLALAAMLETAGRASDAAEALKQAAQAHPTRAELYRQAASLLIDHHRPQEALQLLDQATRTLPEDADLSLMKDQLDASLH